METPIQENMTFNIEHPDQLSTPKSDLAGFDLVLSMSNKAINNNFYFHHKSRHLPHEIDIKSSNSPASIKGKLLPPQLEFWTNGKNPTTEWKVSLVIVFGVGSFTPNAGNGDVYKIRKGDKLAFYVDIGQTHIESHSHIDEMRLEQEVKDKLKSFDPEYFRVTRLYTDLKNAPIFDHIDKEHTTINLTGERLKTFCNLLKSFLLEKTEGHKTSYHIGFIPLQKKGVKTNNPDTPMDFTPTDLRTSVSLVFDKKNNQQTVLNYLMVTKNKEVPANCHLYHVKNYDFEDGYLRLSQKSFVEDYFTNRLEKARKLGKFRLSIDGNNVMWYTLDPRRMKDPYTHTVFLEEKVKLTEIENNTSRLKFEIITDNEKGKYLKIFSETRISRLLRVDNFMLEGTYETTILWEVLPKGNELEFKWIIEGGSTVLTPNTHKKLSEYYGSFWPWWKSFGKFCDKYLYNFEEHTGRVDPNFPRAPHKANPLIKIPITGVFTMNSIDMLPNLQAHSAHVTLDLKVDFK